MLQDQLCLSIIKHHYPSESLAINHHQLLPLPLLSSTVSSTAVPQLPQLLAVATLRCGADSMVKAFSSPCAACWKAPATIQTWAPPVNGGMVTALFSAGDRHLITVNMVIRCKKYLFHEMICYRSTFDKCTTWRKHLSRSTFIPFCFLHLSPSFFVFLHLSPSFFVFLHLSPISISISYIVVH